MIEPSPLGSVGTSVSRIHLERTARFLTARLRRQQEMLIERQLAEVDAAVLRGSGQMFKRALGRASRE